MKNQLAPFPLSRPRRLRQSDWMRRMVSENVIGPDDFIYPMFICEGDNITDPIPSMPGISRLSIDMAIEMANHAANVGIPAIALFPYTENDKKNQNCTEAFNPDNLVNRATRAIRAAVPDIGIMLDVALDPYNSDGHDGILRDGEVINDETLMALEKQAIIQAEAGANILGPSARRGTETLLWCPSHCNVAVTEVHIPPTHAHPPPLPFLSALSTSNTKDQHLFLLLRRNHSFWCQHSGVVATSAARTLHGLRLGR